MTDSRGERPDPADLYADLVDLSEPDRSARLAELERESPALGTELRALLGAAARAGDFLAILSDPSPDVEPVTGGASPFESGHQIGPYRVERKLGQGAIGAVWLAEDARLGRKVALKLFVATPAAGRGAESRRRMLREARAVARLDHPNVAPVFDVGETGDGIAYMAVSWCEGGSLADRLRDGPLSVEQAVAMAVDLASALDAAHGRGVLHRDVKPGNVLFDAAGHTRLGDFGVAAPLSADGPVERLGTLPYAAPEVLCGGRVDVRSDLWSLGVTLCESLTGVRPFRAASRASLVQQIVAGEPAIDDGSQPVIPVSIRVLLDQLLHKNPGQRPQSAAELKRQLLHVQARLRTYRGGYSPPVPLTPLVGRGKLIETALGLLERTRLLTLVGPGGTGKTRLAIALAGRRELHHDAGACFVPLASVPLADLVPHAIADALGLDQRGAVSAAERVRQFCARSDVLLVLDNCEHLPEAAAFIGGLLAQSPRLQVLATSRSPLGVEGEQECPVPPMELPDPAGGSAASTRDTEAVQLFVQRAAARDSTFAVSDDALPLIAGICRRLDGLPLAIELAAARVRTLGLPALLSRLEQSTTWLRAERRDRPARHRTLRDAIGWSYDLLRAEEQRLCRWLSVGQDPWTAEGAASLCDASADALSVLDSLVEHGLVVARPSPGGAPRFSMLATIQEFARERLHAAGETTLALQQHARWYSTLAMSAAGALMGPDQVSWHARLRDVQHDLRAAIAWLIDHGDLTTAARMAVALHRHWLARSSYLREIAALLARLEERIRAPGSNVDATVHANLLVVLGSLTGTIGTHQTIPHRHFEASLERYRATGDRAGMGRALNHMGWSALLLGRLDEAGRASAEALALHRERNDQSGIATSCVNLGWVALDRADFAVAEPYFNEALAIHRRTGDQRSIAYATGHLATLVLRQGDAAGALVRYARAGLELEQIGDQLAWGMRQALTIIAAHEACDPGADLARLEHELLPVLRAAGHGWSIGRTLGIAAELRLEAGDLAGARAAALESLAVRARAGIRSGEAECEVLLGRIALDEGHRAAAARHLATGLATRVAIGERLAMVETVEAIARWTLDDDPACAALLTAGCTAARTALGAARTPRRARRVDAALGTARARCGMDTSDRVEREGASLSLDALVRLAHERLGVNGSVV